MCVFPGLGLVNRPPDPESDGAGALATGLLVMLPALTALAL